MHAYALLPSIPWFSRYWPVVLGLGIALRIAYEWVGTYRKDASWAHSTRTALLAAGGLMWAPLFLSAR